MVKVERSVAIGRSSDDVFAFVADQTNAARWQSGILEVRRLTDGPPGLGTRHVFTRTLMGRRMTGENEYVEFVPGRRVAFRTTSGPGLLASYDVAPGSTGARLTATIELDVSGIMTVAAPLVARTLRRDVEANLARLKDILEEPANQAAADALERGHATGPELVR
jgi:carbon monoxide dehydrogenase subunit G